MERIGLMASEEKSFENVDGQTDERTVAGCLYYTLSIISTQQVSIYTSGRMDRQTPDACIYFQLTGELIIYTRTFL